ncbi:ParM/StbA family protein [Oculatella sp. FACHB-28]|uniref:ParM/StbA family protein n=1 Tax=Oculatella sp. FACHB-28 TaxID=2692845 RepID=UPI00168A0C19|nr:ParM/StbA family protein [Oculatella sp. FACHB-28]MBD2057895.1 ParM/StbA family protein [Oculatella sp. FACHB-28]
MASVLSKTTKGTSSEHLGNTGLIRSLVCFDGGNRTLQWLDPCGRVRSIPAFIKHFDPSWQDMQPDDQSVVIEFESEHFVLGAVARDNQGTPVVQDDKCELARKLVLAALEPNPGQNAVRVERLAIALPTSRSELAVKQVRAIEGTHEFTRNGESIIATVRKVEPIDETLAAYRWASLHRLYSSKQNINGVLDLGGGTGIGRLYSVSGSLMRDADLILPGTKELAIKISVRLNAQIGASAPLAAIMDGVERGDYELGTSGVNFRGAFENARAEWLDEIRGEVKTRWGRWLSSGELGEVIVVGGSAPLAEPLQAATKGRFRIAPDPQFISISGMARL